MDINELKKLIREKYEEDGEKSFEDLINEEGWESEAEEGETNVTFKDATGLSFEFLDSERDYDCYVWRFKIGEKTYEVSGSYDSWNGTEMDDAFDFYEVELVEKTIKVWEPV